MLDFKRIIVITIIILIIIGLSLGVYFYINKENEENEEMKEITEITPQEEISEEQMRQTMVSLYYKNEEQLMPEARLIDVKDLIENPYVKIINMLLEGPKNEKLQKIIPEGTKLNKVEKKGEKLIIDFSEEFNKIKEKDKEDIELVVQSIEKTITQLTEINEIEININNIKMD